MIPLRVDRRLRYTPWVNLTLIAVNVAVFLLTYAQIRKIHAAAYLGVPPSQLMQVFPVYRHFLHPSALALGQFFTYQFLHADVMHLGGNMLFLYIFGGSLEDRLGPVGYLLFYLAGGVFAGIGHVLTTAGPALGASGAISATTGGFLALFPLTHVTVLMLFYYVFLAEWPSVYFIGLSLAWDLYHHLGGGAGVAYMAHISGNVYGFVVGMALLAARVLPRDTYDFLALADRWNRRRQFRAITTQGHSPWQDQAAATMAGKKLTEKQEQIVKLRADVQVALRNHDGPPAVAAHERLMAMDPEQSLPRQAQLDVAGFAMSTGRYDLAARAYETFRRVYPNDPFTHEVHLILGLIYARYLNDRARGRPLLELARDRHGDANRRALAGDILAEIGR